MCWKFSNIKKNRTGNTGEGKISQNLLIKLFWKYDGVKQSVTTPFPFQPSSSTLARVKSFDNSTTLRSTRTVVSRVAMRSNDVKYTNIFRSQRHSTMPTALINTSTINLAICWSDFYAKEGESIRQESRSPRSQTREPNLRPRRFVVT